MFWLLLRADWLDRVKMLYNNTTFLFQDKKVTEIYKYVLDFTNNQVGE